MTVVLITVLTILALSFGFHFGRAYEAERRRPKPPGTILNLHPHEWERVT